MNTVKRKQVKKKKRGISFGNLLDLVLILAYAIMATVLLLNIHGYSTLLTWIALACILILFIIYLLLLKGKTVFIRFFRKIFIIGICAIQMFVNSKIDSFDQLFDSLGFQPSSEIVITDMTLYSLASHEYFDAVVTSTADLSGKKVAIQLGSDKEASVYVQEQIDTNHTAIDYVEYSDYHSMMNDLYYGYVDAAIINQNMITSLSDDFAIDTDFIHLQDFHYEVELSADHLDKDITKEVFTILISGSDEPGDLSKTDMNMLLVIDPISHHISAISIPRDAYIPNPAYGNTSDKLTHTGQNGANNTLLALERAFDIEIDFYIKVSFTSIINIVDTLGGITVDVPITFCEQDENRSFAQEDIICIEAGTQVLDGRSALAYTRHRDSYIDQDLGRNQAQINVIKGMLSNLLTPEGLTTKVDALLKIIPEYVLTNFSTNQMKVFIKYQLDTLEPWTIDTVTLSHGIPDLNYTASTPYQLVSVYYLANQDVQLVNAIYELTKQDHTFSEFSFDINELYKDHSSYENNYEMILY